MRSALRIWNPSTTTNEINSSPVGQTFWDSLKSRLGVFNNRSGKVEWYPEVTDDLTLNRSQLLRGRDSEDAVNSVVISYDTPGFIKIIHVPSSTVLASFSSAGVVLHSASLSVNGVPGITNQILNGAMQVKRSLIPFDKSGVMSDMNAWTNNNIVAPNWMAYRAPGSAGHVAFYIDPDVPAGVGAVNSCRIDSKGAPTNAGLRHWLLDIKALIGKTVTLSVYVKGPVGSQCRARVITEMGGEIANINFTGTGSWTRQVITLTLPQDTSRWLAFDSLYRPGHASASPVTWRAAAPQLNNTGDAMTFEPRPADLESALLKGIFAERFGVLTIGSSIGTAINLDMVDMTGVTPTTKIVVDTGTATFASVNNKYGIIAPGSTAGSVKVMAAMLPPTTETGPSENETVI
jgi:hypothetical protein